jgi:hypothetical protein
MGSKWVVENVGRSSKVRTKSPCSPHTVGTGSADTELGPPVVLDVLAGSVEDGDDDAVVELLEEVEVVDRTPYTAVEVTRVVCADAVPLRALSELDEDDGVLEAIELSVAAVLTIALSAVLAMVAPLTLESVAALAGA